MLFHRLGDRVICAIWGVSLLCVPCFSSPLLLFNTVHLLLFCLPLCLFLVTPFHWWRSGCSKLAVDLCCLWLFKGPQGTIFKGSNFQKCWAGLTGLQCYGKCPASLNMRLLTNVFSKRPKSTSPRLVNSFGKLSCISYSGWVLLPFSSNKQIFSLLFSYFPQVHYLCFCFSLLWSLPTFYSAHDHSPPPCACHVSFFSTIIGNPQCWCAGAIFVLKSGFGRNVCRVNSATAMKKINLFALKCIGNISKETHLRRCSCPKLNKH